MVTIRNIDETFRFYGSFGAKQMDVGNGTCFTFPDNSYIRFWGDLHGFCVAAVDFTPPEDAIFRSQIQQRYLGIGFHEEGHYVSYMRKSDARDSTSGISCFVFPSPAPHFLKLMGGQRLRFHGMYFQEQFFRENGLQLYGSFVKRHKALAVRIAELTEDLEELRFEKALLLQKFEYAEDAGAEAFRKDIATMEACLKKLETREQKYSVELDKALTEYAELKAQAADFDPVELYKAWQVIRPAQEKAAEQQLEDAMHEKPSLIMLLSAKQETSHLLGADAEERQARQLIMHRNQEQYRNSLSKRKRNDPER